jgi:hypothetical protein
MGTASRPGEETGVSFVAARGRIHAIGGQHETGMAGQAQSPCGRHVFRGCGDEHGQVFPSVFIREIRGKIHL